MERAYEIADSGEAAASSTAVNEDEEKEEEGRLPRPTRRAQRRCMSASSARSRSPCDADCRIRLQERPMGDPIRRHYEGSIRARITRSMVGHHRHSATVQLEEDRGALSETGDCGESDRDVGSPPRSYDTRTFFRADCDPFRVIKSIGAAVGDCGWRTQRIDLKRSQPAVGRFCVFRLVSMTRRAVRISVLLCHSTLTQYWFLNVTVGKSE